MDDIYRLRAEVRELADELTRLRTWDSGGGSGSGGAQVAKVASGGISAATSITAPGSGSVVVYNYDPATPLAGSTVTVRNPFKIAVAANTTVVVTLCGGAWVLTAMECS